MITKESLRRAIEKSAERVGAKTKHKLGPLTFGVDDSLLYQRGFRAGANHLAPALLVLAEALEAIKVRLQYGLHTMMMPINIRELDGSVSIEREKTNEGHAYQYAVEALDRAAKLLGMKEGE